MLTSHETIVFIVCDSAGDVMVVVRSSASDVDDYCTKLGASGTMVVAHSNANDIIIYVVISAALLTLLL